MRFYGYDLGTHKGYRHMNDGYVFVAAPLVGAITLLADTCRPITYQKQPPPIAAGGR
jgi:hypothetical protein